TALLLTQSRGGFVALCAALAAFVWSLRQSALIAPAASLKAAAVLTLGLTLGLVWLAGEQTLGRFATDAQAIHRLAYYRATWEAIADRPLLGTGYGTYPDALKAYNRPDTGTYFPDKAPNTYPPGSMGPGRPAPPGRRSPTDRCSAPATAPTPTRSRPTTVRTPAPTSSTRRTTPICR